MLLVSGAFRSRAGRNWMKRFCGAFAAVAFVLAGFPVAQVRAAPPTVTPSPGYDARLQEQRAATAPAAPVDPFADSLARPVDRRQHARRSHHAPAAPLSKKSNGR
jgi:hypothetical protein